jgi:hypothetical protein
MSGDVKKTRRPRGRPPLTPEDVRARIAGYCERYGVQPGANGLPPFPSGQRETAQHREWLSVYRANQRLQRRSPPSVEQLQAAFEAQNGRCPVCGEAVDLVESVPHRRPDGGIRAVLHPRCHKLVAVAEDAGSEALERARAYLWPNADTSTR